VSASHGSLIGVVVSGPFGGGGVAADAVRVRNVDAANDTVMYFRVMHCSFET
jgi:hypothetical protein